MVLGTKGQAWGGGGGLGSRGGGRKGEEGIVGHPGGLDRHLKMCLALSVMQACGPVDREEVETVARH